MKKRVLFFAVMVVMVIMIAAGCQSATAAEIEVSGEKVPSLYSALGQERKVVSTGTEATIGKTTKTVGYSGVTSEDLMSYYDYLGANGYICTDESSTSIQMAREAAEDGYIVLVDMVLTSADTAEITYTYAVGELTYYD